MFVVQQPHLLNKVEADASTHKNLLVAKELTRAIQSGAYQVGDRLPPERTLAKLLGVSRAAVREALSALHVVGAVVSIVGDGTYVRSRLEASDVDHALGLLEVEGDLEDWIEAREVIETAVACLAIERAGEKDLAQLESALARMSGAIEGLDLDEYLQADLAFHKSLFQAGHNETLNRAASVLLASMQRQLWKTLKRNYYTRKRLLANSYRRHSRIVDALRMRDEEEMKSAFKAHFRFLSDEVEEE